MLQVISHLLLVDDIGDLGGVAKEVKVLAHIGGAKGLVVERVLVLVQLVTQPIVGILEVDAIHEQSARRRIATCSGERYLRIIVIVVAFGLGSGDLGEGVGILEDASLLLRRLPISGQGGVEAKERHGGSSEVPSPKSWR